MAKIKKTSKTYDASNIKILDELESIRRNPGKDIGDTATPIHLLHECIDNALDEVVQQSSKAELRVDIDNKKHIYSVSDTGRGIPLGTIKYNGKDVPVPILICSKLFSSGKFDDKAYFVPAGLHGIGLVAVNALSEWVELHIHRDNKYAYVRFENGIAVTYEEQDKPDQRTTGTKIIFKPDKKYFDKLYIDPKLIEDRLIYALLYDDLRKSNIYLNNHKIEVPKIPPLLEKEECIAITKLSYKNPSTNEEVIIWFGWTKKNDFNTITVGSVNRIPIHSGTHINYSLNAVRAVLSSTRWSKSLPNNNDYLRGLRLVCLTQIKETKFLGQTKDRLLTPLKYFNNIFNDKLAKQFDKLLRDNKKLKSDIDRIIVRIYDYLHIKKSKVTLKELTENSAVSENGKHKAVRGLSDVSILKDCLSEDVSKCNLYIVEGRSASGPVSEARNPKYDAILLLQGKIVNVGKHDNLYKMLNSTKSKELLALIKALGCGVNISNKSKFDIAKLRYNNIIICADADPDGAHIVCLLLTIFMRLMQPIIEAGKLLVCEAPLYGLTNKKNAEFIPFWSLNDMNQYLSNNGNKDQYHIHRFKGLGEMNSKQLHTILFNPSTRRLVKLSIGQSMDYAKKLMANSTKIRYNLLEEANLIINDLAKLPQDQLNAYLQEVN